MCVCVCVRARVCGISYYVIIFNSFDSLDFIINISRTLITPIHLSISRLRTMMREWSNYLVALFVLCGHLSTSRGASLSNNGSAAGSNALETASGVTGNVASNTRVSPESVNVPSKTGEAEIAEAPAEDSEILGLTDVSRKFLEELIMSVEKEVEEKWREEDEKSRSSTVVPETVEKTNAKSKAMHRNNHKHEMNVGNDRAAKINIKYETKPNRIATPSRGDEVAMELSDLANLPNHALKHVKKRGPSL